MNENLKEKSFEEALSRLEEIVSKLENGELVLEESLKLFEEGIILARHCHSKLDEAQGRVELLLGIEGETVKTVEFQPEEE